MAYRNMTKTDRNRITSLMNRLENYKYGQQQPSSSSQNGNYANAAFANSYDQMDDADEFHNYASDQSNEEDSQLPDLQEQLKRERRIKKNLQNRLMQLQAVMKKKQLQENEKLCKKLSNSLTGAHHLRNSLQNRRFEGDGSEDDDDLANTQTKISKSRLNYQSAVNYHPNNCPNNFRGSASNASFPSNSLAYPNGHLNDLNGHHLNDRATYPSGSLKFEEIDKLIKIIKQEQVLNDLNGQMAKNSLNDDCSSSLNSRGSLTTKNQFKQNNLASHRAHSNVDNHSVNSLDGHLMMNNGHLLQPHGGQSNDLSLNEQHLKKQIVASMKSNFHSMIEFIESQTFSCDHFMAIQQLINLIMMQNCQFMNHQQVLLCWLQKLQFQLCNSAQPVRSPPMHSAYHHHLPNNLATNDATGDQSTLLADTPMNEHQLNGAGQQLNNASLKMASGSALNNSQPTEASLLKNSFYDNLKSHHHHSLPMYQQNQLSSTKLKNAQVPANFKLNNKLNKSCTNKNANELKEMYNLIKELIEDKHNATGKPNNFLNHPTEFGEFDEPGAVGGIEELDELSDLTDNLHASNLNGANLNNLNNHLVSNGHSNTANGAAASVNNKSPQMILNLPSGASGSSAVRKKTTTVTNVNSSSNAAAVVNQRKNAPDVIESISCSDDLIKSHSSESIRPLMAAEGRSSEFNPNQPPTTLLPNPVAKTINNGASTKITSTIGATSAINGQNPIVATAAASANSTNNASVLLKRPPTTGASRRNDFQNDDNDDTEETSDDDLANRNQVTTPEAQSSENSTSTSNLPPSNANTVPPFLENATLDADQQLVDGQLGFANLNGRNDSEIRLSGDGI